VIALFFIKNIHIPKSKEYSVFIKINMLKNNNIVDGNINEEEKKKEKKKKKKNKHGDTTDSTSLGAPHECITDSTFLDAPHCMAL
jgi:hypothetical protein